jgi:TonB family protein
MTSGACQPELPWSQVREEDQRFQRILVLSLAVSLTLGALAPYIPLPLEPLAATPELPARKVRLLEAATPTVLEQVQVIVPPSKLEPRAVSQPAAAPTPTLPPVADAGVLAMRGALASLQDRSPRTSTQPGRLEERRVQAADQQSLLSDGIVDLGISVQLGVTREDMLGSTELPSNLGGGSLSPDVESGSRGGDAVVSFAAGQRSEEGIQEVLDRHKGEMFKLYNRALRSDPDLRGELMLAVSIDASGRVTQCSIISSNLGAASLERDLVVLVSSLSFGSIPGAGVVTTRVPIEFFPQ